MRRCHFFVMLLALLIGSCAHSSAAPPVTPDLKACKPPTSAQATWLDSTWHSYIPFVRVCPVRTGHSKPALLIVSVWAEIYYAQQPSAAVTVPMPKPLIFTTAGRNVGEIPMNYPDDPPHELVLTFKNWKDGLPHRIELTVKSPTASDGQELAPLNWDKATRKYAAGS